MKHTHTWTTIKGIDRCVCGITFLEHARGFGSNAIPKKFLGHDPNPPKLPRSRQSPERQAKDRAKLGQ